MACGAQVAPAVHATWILKTVKPLWWDSAGGSLVKTSSSNAGVWVQSLVRELGSHMPHSQKPKHRMETVLWQIQQRPFKWSASKKKKKKNLKKKKETTLTWQGPKKTPALTTECEPQGKLCYTESQTSKSSPVQQNAAQYSTTQHNPIQQAQYNQFTPT